MRNIPLIKLSNEFSVAAKTPEFKCRAETIHDIKLFFKACEKAGIKISNIKIEPQFLNYNGKKVQIPDVELTFSSDEELGTLKHVLALVPDGHVMHETLTHSSHYDGDRSYSNKPKLD